MILQRRYRVMVNDVDISALVRSVDMSLTVPMIPTTTLVLLGVPEIDPDGVLTFRTTQTLDQAGMRRAVRAIRFRDDVPSGGDEEHGGI